MKFVVERDVLADAVGWVARALPARPPSPVLAGVRIKAKSDDGGTVTLASFDYEVSAKADISADVEEPGEVLVSGRLLAEIARLLPAKPVTIRLEGPKTVVTCGASTFTLLTMPLDDYPSLPPMPNAVGAIEAGRFQEAVSQVAVAATRDETLPLLTGVRVEIEGETLTLLATDRYRLAIKELTWKPTSPTVSRVAVVRARTLTEVAKAFGHTEQIEVALTAPGLADIVGFGAAGKETTSLLIDGDYPPVRKLLPSNSEITAVVAVAELQEAARRVSLVAERNTPVQIAFTAGQAVLNAGTGDDAQASEVIEATLEGEDITVAFNPHYLLDGLGVIGAPYVRLSMTNATKPVLFEGMEGIEGPAKVDYKYLLVPIRFTV
ncbi:MAG: DNA polymerase III subunit beta [Bifidobacteriaceae bacterium]|jgi:DNA polymerase-3 subunit beta|nr:DNA polymerase III subunit beta [Bifidobacteriaceae bacterium]